MIGRRKKTLLILKISTQTQECLDVQQEGLACLYCKQRAGNGGEQPNPLQIQMWPQACDRSLGGEGGELKGG